MSLLGFMNPGITAALIKSLGASDLDTVKAHVPRGRRRKAGPVRPAGSKLARKAKLGKIGVRS